MDATLDQLQEMVRSMDADELRSFEIPFLKEIGLEHIKNLDLETIRSKDLRSLSTVDLDDAGSLAKYLQWSFTSHEPLAFSELLPRPKLNSWLFTIFFKIAIPVNRKSQDWHHTLIYAPLNLTIFFRLLIHLHQVGYPSHWLSDVLVQILENQVGMYLSTLKYLLDQ